MKEEITPELIEKIVKKVLKDERDEFWVPQPQHYLDHEMIRGCREASPEWRKNHEFISAVRTGASYGQRAGIILIVTSSLSFLGWAMWQAVKIAVFKE